MNTKLVAKDTVQITCSLRDLHMLIHGIISAQADDEDFVKRFENDETLAVNVQHCKENVEDAKRILAELVISA